MDGNFDVNRKYNGATLLYWVCAKQNENMVKRLLSMDSNLNIQNVDGKTALHVACAKNNLKIVKMLLNKDADVNICDNIGNTPLHLACVNGNDEIVLLLLNKNANVNTLAKYGITPLHYACLVGNYDITKLLLKACANPNIKDESGKLAINIACSNNYPDIVNELIKANSIVPLNIIDWAIHKEEMEILKSLAKRKDIAKYLIKKLIVSNKIGLLRKIRDARINLNSIEKIEGESLLELAIRNNNVDMANMLMACNFGNINNTVAKLNELVNNSCANELLKEPKNEQETIIKNIKMHLKI